MTSEAALARSIASWVLAVGVVIPSAARAQDPVSSFADLPRRLNVGDTVSVTDTAGREHKGKVAQLSATFLLLQTGSTQLELPSANVLTVSQRQPDSLRNGAFIGLAVGAALGAAVLGYAEAEDPGDTSTGAAVAVVAVPALAFMGIGVAIDAASVRTVPIYRAAAAAPPGKISVSPLVSPRRQGLAVSVRF